MTEPHKKYGLARKFNPRTGHKEWCIAVFVDDYPEFPIHFFGPTRPSRKDVSDKMSMAPVLELQARNDYVIRPFPYGFLGTEHPPKPCSIKDIKRIVRYMREHKKPTVMVDGVECYQIDPQTSFPFAKPMDETGWKDISEYEDVPPTTSEFGKIHGDVRMFKHQAEGE